MHLKRHMPGRWIVQGYADATIYAVRCNRCPNVWELQHADGSLAFGDGFEGLASVRAWLQDQSAPQGI